MKKITALFLTALLPGATAFGSEHSNTLQLTLDNGQTVTVSEGPGEARSIGSFAIRRYAKAEPGDETTFFLDGQVHERDGYVERAEVADLNGDGRSELIVIVRSAGSGGYLSAHAFNVDPRLSSAGSLEGLPADADPVELLTAAPTLQSEAIEEVPAATVTEQANEDTAQGEPQEQAKEKEGYSETGRKRGCPPGKRC